MNKSVVVIGQFDYYYFLFSQEWLTSGRRTVGNNFRWEGDGEEIQGYQYWLMTGDNTVGDAIVYKSDGKFYGISVYPFG